MTAGARPIRRGDLVTVALPGNYGKPRPALVIQSDLFEEHPSVTILPITSELKAHTDLPDCDSSKSR